jgi:hypothetical protein
MVTESEEVEELARLLVTANSGVRWDALTSADQDSYRRLARVAVGVYRPLRPDPEPPVRVRRASHHTVKVGLAELLRSAGVWFGPGAEAHLQIGTSQGAAAVALDEGTELVLRWSELEGA